MTRFNIFLIALLSALLLQADAETDAIAAIVKLNNRITSDNALDVFVNTTGTSRAKEGLSAMNSAFYTLLGTSRNPRLPMQRLRTLITVSDARLFMSLIYQHGHTKAQGLKDLAFKKWLFMNEKRCKDFLNNVDIWKDDFGAAIDVLYQIYLHDSQDREKTWPLMLAMALVWDTPDRIPLHYQIGSAMLPYSPDITERYDFFKKRFMGGTAPFSLHKMPIQALCFVVDTPVPVSELEWAIKNVRKKSPDDIFNSIAYDQRRFKNASSERQFTASDQIQQQAGSLYWTNGNYSLANIRKYGGLCSDQAYYTTMVLRARGIPALLLVGMGRRGGHAWVAYMKSLKTWKSDVGRYDKDKYTTGTGYHPQTGFPFNDHLLPLLCRKMVETESRYGDSSELTRLALMLQSSNYLRAARKAAEMSLEIDSKDLTTWHILARSQTNDTKRIRVMERLAQAFKNFPDLVTDFKLKQAALLRESGKDMAAEQILRKLPQENRKREDLKQKVIREHVKDALEDQKPKKARLILENHLKDNRKEAAKLLDDITFYLELTQKTEQTKEAVNFLESFIRSIRRSFNRANADSPQYQNWDKVIMIRAYENNSDDKKAKRLKRQLE